MQTTGHPWLHGSCCPLFPQVVGAQAPPLPLNPPLLGTAHPRQHSTFLPGCVNDRKKQLRQLFRSLQGQKKTPN